MLCFTLNSIAAAYVATELKSISELYLVNNLDPPTFSASAKCYTASVGQFECKDEMLIGLY